MGRFLWIFILIRLDFGGKSDRIEETTSVFQSAYQSTTLTSESQHEAKNNAAGIMRGNFSSPTYNNQYMSNSSTIKLAASSTNRFSRTSSTISETSYKNIFNNTVSESFNNNSFNESKFEKKAVSVQSSLSTDKLNIFTEQITIASMFREKEIKYKANTLKFQFQNESFTTPIMFENENGTKSPHAIGSVISTETNTSTPNLSGIANENILNNTLVMSKYLSTSYFTFSDLYENSTTATNIPERDNEEYLLKNSRRTNSTLKYVENVENTSKIIKNIALSEPVDTDITQVYITNSESSNFEEIETFTPTLSTLVTINTENSSENYIGTTEESLINNNKTLNRMYNINVTTSAKNNLSFHTSEENAEVIKQEHSVSINQSSVMEIHTENIASFLSTQQTRLVTRNHELKEFLFKHINNLTDNQRINMTVDIIFTYAVDIVEWFHSYDTVFRTAVASLLTKTNESQSVQSVNIVYIAPTPLKNEKYFCITFMVESGLQKNVYEHGDAIVQKMKQNISGLAEMLQLPVESVMSGYNATSKCHKSYLFTQERNWVIIVVLGTILSVAIVVILTMCVQKSRNEKQTWEQDVQEWSAAVHGETGRYSGYRLPISVQNSSSTIIHNLPRVNHVISSKEENNSFVPNNGVEKVLIHNEEKNNPDTLCGECNNIFVEDTKL